MAAIFTYAIVSSLILIALYLPYRLLLSSLKQPAINRATILVIYLVALTAWPLTKWIGSSANAQPAAFVIPTDFGEIATIVDQPVNLSVTAADIMLVVYLAGALIALLTIAIATVRLLSKVRRSPRLDIDGTRVYITHNPRLAPFSFFGIIAIPATDLSDAPLILAHERQHVSRRHSLDLIAAQLVAIFQWFNPAAWLMMRELKTVHELEVDDRLIASGINIKQYQYLLIKKAVGARFPSLANNLNHSNLKLRITMMLKTKDAGSRRWRALALVPALAVALSVTHLQSVASALSATASSRLPQLSGSKVSENSTTPQESQLQIVAAEANNSAGSMKVTPAIIAADESTAVVETIAQFPGGEAEMMRCLYSKINYPAEALENNQQGRVVVKFTIDKTGKVSNPQIVKSVSPALDAEAKRAVADMPDFIPATVDGKPVATTYVIPVEFRLQTDKKVIEQASEIKSEIKDGNVTIFINGEVADNATLSKVKSSSVSSINIIKNDPDYPDGYVSVTTGRALFINGQQRPYEQLNSINPSDIKSIEVIKNDADYPQGKIMVTLK